MKRERYRKRTQQKRRAIPNKLLTIMGIFLILVLICSINELAFQAKVTEDLNSYKYFTEVRVSNGMTLWDIAQEYISPEYTSVNDYIREVKEVNSIYTDEIYYGQSLMVPYYSDELK